MKSVKTPALFIALLAFSYLVKANYDGEGAKQPSLLINVLDAFSKKPVKGVSVFITSLSDKVEQSFVTDNAGNFTIPQMPAGEFTIILEKKGYKTYRREKLVVKEGTLVKLKVGISNEMQNEDNNIYHPLWRMMQW